MKHAHINGIGIFGIVMWLISSGNAEDHIIGYLCMCLFCFLFGLHLLVEDD